MKNIFLIVILLLTVITISAQTTFVGRVESGNVPLAGVAVAAVNGEGRTISQEDGSFEITLKSTKNVKIELEGYQTKQVYLSIKKPNIVVLIKGLSLLEEVVVSASREIQKRNEVPNAITVIGIDKINETKAIGLDQLLNDVPGVYQSTSRASSNEQHFTAVRSPISTKPLFLFLEDGLPIRPTAIFNHNALLETNQIAYDRLEVLRGPAASIYGSDAIGGSFNFITKSPTKNLEGSLILQGNELGYSSVAFDIGKQVTDKFGIYIASQFNQRNNGPFGHSDYDKYALTVKTVLKPFYNSKLTFLFSGVDFYTDMAGSISEKNFFNKNFNSDQTFTKRNAESYRMRGTWEQKWDNKNKTSFSAVYRDNIMRQNPSYRIHQNRAGGRLTGTGSGEINSNAFKNYFGNIQHQIQWDTFDIKLILGATLDFAKQDYVAEKTDVSVDPVSRKNVGFNVRSGDFILNYNADILNYAGYAQFEISPIEKVKFTLGGRYDGFEYDFNNRKSDENVLQNRRDAWDKFAPKVGLNFNYSNTGGIYMNYSKGFTPPQSSTLYRSTRNRNVDVKPSNYNNYEIGAYSQLTKKIKIDAALYYLKGRNTLITIRDPESERAFINTNAGKTSSYGAEYGIAYQPIKQLKLSHNGTFAAHKYDVFIFKGKDFSNTNREIAPSLIGTTRVRVVPTNGLAISFEHELMGDYNTSLERQAKDENGNLKTTTYAGHNVFNLQLSYQYKKVEVWMHLLNVFDKIYANRVSYNRFQNENSFTVANPRAFHFGAKYNF